MTYSETLTATKTLASRAWLWPLVVVGATIVAYIPTFITLAQGPWQTEQEGHGPLIIAASIFLVWQAREKLRSVTITPSPILGWLSCTGGLVVLIISRNQDIWFTEVASEIPVLAGCVLIFAG